MFWNLLRLQNLERLWMPSRGRNYGIKLQELGEVSQRPARLRLYSKGRFH